MKKSLLNTAISMALSGALFSASVLSTQAYADEITSTDNNNSTDNTTETYMLPGMGAGAAAGAVVAGPVGLLIGGIIGAFVGNNQEVETDNQEALIADVTSDQDTALLQEAGNIAKENIDSQSDTAFSDNSTDEIHVAQLGAITPVVEEQSNPVQDELVNILTTDLSLDVYFRSGSTAIETFYPERLAAIAELMKTMDTLELHLDGYTDRRGNKSQNIILANQRIDKVRQQLVSAGVEDHRIISKAFGEMKMVSSPGDLDGYTFDRKVVIRFERTGPDSIQSMTTALSNTTEGTTDVSLDKTGNDTSSETSKDPVVADAATRF